MTITAAALDVTFGVSGLAPVQNAISGVDQQVERLGKGFTERLNSMAASATRFGGVLSVAVTTPLVAIGKSSITAASDLNEAMSAVNTVFGSASETITRFADTSATQLGISEQAALSAAGQLGALFSGLGVQKQQAADFSTQLLQTASDLGSFYNVEPGEAFTALRSGLIGEAEPLRRFGILLSATAVEQKALEMGLGGVTGALTEQDKVLARYELILDQVGAAGGDFARTSDGLANSQRILTAELTNLSAEFGEVLLPYVMDGVGLARQAIKWFSALSKPMKLLTAGAVAAAAAAGPLLVVFGGIAKAVALLRPALLLLTGPIGLIVAALGGLFVAYQTNFLGFADGAQGALDWLQETFQDVSDAVQGAIQTFSDLTARGFNPVEAAARSFNGILRGLGLGGFSDELRGLIDIGRRFGEVLGTLGRYFGLVVTDGDHLNDFLGQLPSGIQPVVQLFGNLIGTIQRVIEGFGAGGLRGAVEAFLGSFDGLRDSAGRVLGQLWQIGGDILGAIWQGIQENAPRLWGWFTTTFVPGVVSALTGWWSEIDDEIEYAIDMFRVKLSTKWELKIKPWLQTLPGEIGKTIGNIKDWTMNLAAPQLTLWAKDILIWIRDKIFGPEGLIVRLGGEGKASGGESDPVPGWSLMLGSPSLTWWTEDIGPWIGDQFAKLAAIVAELDKWSLSLVSPNILNDVLGVVAWLDQWIEDITGVHVELDEWSLSLKPPTINWGEAAQAPGEWLEGIILADLKRQQGGITIPVDAEPAIGEEGVENAIDTFTRPFRWLWERGNRPGASATEMGVIPGGVAGAASPIAGTTDGELSTQLRDMLIAAIQAVNTDQTFLNTLLGFSQGITLKIAAGVATATDHWTAFENNIRTNITDAITAVTTDQTVLDQMATIGTTIAQKAGTGIGEHVINLQLATQAMVQASIQFGVDHAKALAPNIGITIVTNAGVTMGELVTGFAEAVKAVVGAAILQAESYAEEQAAFIGGAIVTGATLGVKLAAPVLDEAVREMANSATRTAETELESESPSQVFVRIGQTIPQGLAVGIEQGMPAVSATLQAWMDSLVSSAEGGITFGIGKNPFGFDEGTTLHNWNNVMSEAARRMYAKQGIEIPAGYGLTDDYLLTPSDVEQAGADAGTAFGTSFTQAARGAMQLPTLTVPSGGLTQPMAAPTTTYASAGPGGAYASSGGGSIIAASPSGIGRSGDSTPFNPVDNGGVTLRESRQAATTTREASERFDRGAQKFEQFVDRLLGGDINVTLMIDGQQISATVLRDLRNTIRKGAENVRLAGA